MKSLTICCCNPFVVNRFNYCSRPGTAAIAVKQVNEEPDEVVVFSAVVQNIGGNHHIIL